MDVTRANNPQKWQANKQLKTRSNVRSLKHDTMHESYQAFQNIRVFLHADDNPSIEETQYHSSAMILVQLFPTRKLQQLEAL
jgi:hypothetical protein